MIGNHYEFGVISDDYRILSRLQEISGQFNYDFKHWKTVEDFENQLGKSPEDFRLLIAAVTDPKSKRKAPEITEIVRKYSPSSFLICSVASTLAKETAELAKKAGADLILLEDEILRTSKLDYACSEIVRANYLAIKVTDVVPERELEFDIYHLLPQRQKFLKFLFEGDVLSEAKAKKLEMVGEIYIRRNQASRFSEYVKRYQEATREGLAKRCRAEFLALYSSFAHLAFMLTDQSENSSFKEGETLMKRSRILAGELVSTLASYGNPFEIVNNSTVGEFGSVERTPAIAAYVGYFALQLEVEDIDELMMGALLGNIGILLLPPFITEKLRLDQLEELSPEEFALYERYPQDSLDLALGRKLPIDPPLRKSMLSILQSHALVHFCTELDRRTLVKLGKPRANPQIALNKLIVETVQKAGRFAPDSENYLFAMSLKKKLWKET